MTWHTKVSGAWKEITDPQVKVSGAWKEISEGHVKVSGAWKQFYSRIVAYLDDKSVDLDGSTEYFEKDSQVVWGTGNVWSFMFWVKWTDDGQTVYLFEWSASAADPDNNTRLNIGGGIANNPAFFKMLDSGGGTEIRDLRYDNLFNSNAWTQVVMTWQGNDTFNMYKNGSFVAPTTTFDSNADSQSNASRKMAIGGRLGGNNKIDGRIHSVALWDVELTADEVAAIYNSGDGGGFDLAEDAGNYTSSANLEHWWKMGLDSSSDSAIGTDYGVGVSINMMDDAVGITTADVVTDSP
jgi:hypothetical protein